MKRQSILLLARTGFIIRDIFLGQFTDCVLDECDLYVAVLDPNDINLLSFISGKQIKLVKYLIDNEKRSQLRDYLGAQHWMYRIKQAERNNTSLEVNTRLLKSKYTPRKRFLVSIMLRIAYVIKKLNLLNISENLFLLFVSKMEITNKWKTLIKEINPSIIVSTGLTLPMGLFLPSPDLPAIIAGRKLNIPCGTLIQSWDNLSSKTYVLPKWLDRYWTWSNKMSADLIKFNPRIDNGRIKVVGSPHYDFHLDKSIHENRDTFLKTLGLNPSLPYIVVGTGTSSMFPDAPNSVIELVKTIRNSQIDANIVVRIHPKDNIERWLEVEDELNSMGAILQNTAPNHPMDLGGFVFPKDYFRDLVNTIRHAAVVINVSSSLTVDAAILDTPVISLCYDKIPDNRFPEGRSYTYNFSEHFTPLIESGGVKAVFSDAECIQAIISYMNDRDLDREGRREIARLIGGPIEGNAGVRLANEVKAVVFSK